MTIAQHPTFDMVPCAVVRSHCIGVQVNKRRHKESLNFYIKLGEVSNEIF